LQIEPYLKRTERKTENLESRTERTRALASRPGRSKMAEGESENKRMRDSENIINTGFSTGQNCCLTR
jgi:hypothetical protein